MLRRGAQNVLLQETLEEQRYSRRLAEEPLLFVSTDPGFRRPKAFHLNNQGRGLAIKCTLWVETDDTRSKFNNFVSAEPGFETEWGGNLAAGDTVDIQLDVARTTSEGEPLVIAQCFDRFGRWFQHRTLFQKDGLITSAYFREPLADFAHRSAQPGFRWS